MIFINTFKSSYPNPFYTGFLYSVYFYSTTLYRFIRFKGRSVLNEVNIMTSVKWFTSLRILIVELWFYAKTFRANRGQHFTGGWDKTFIRLIRPPPL